MWGGYVGRRWATVPAGTTALCNVYDCLCRYVSQSLTFRNCDTQDEQVPYSILGEHLDTTSWRTGLSSTFMQIYVELETLPCARARRRTCCLVATE
jgi:hypothetical protein